MTDEQLALRAQAGSRLAAAQLIARNEGILRGIVSEYFADGSERADLRQEARLAAVIAIRDYRYDRGARFSSFLRLVVRHHIIKIVRVSTRKKHRPLTDAVRTALNEDNEPIEILELLEASGTDPVELIDARDRFRAVVAGFNELTDLERSATIGFFFDGEPYDRIAARSSTTTKSVDNALQRARMKLRDAMGKAA